MLSQYNILYNLILIDGIYNSLYFGYIKYKHYYWTSREIIRHSKLFQVKLIDRYTWYIIMYILFERWKILHWPLLLANNPVFLNTMLPILSPMFRTIDNFKFSILKFMYTILIIEHVQFTDINPYHIYCILTIDNMTQCTYNYILFIVMTLLKQKTIFYYYYKLVKYLYYYNSGYKYETKNLNMVIGYFSQVTDNNSWIIEVNSPLFANCLVLMGVYNQFYTTFYYDVQYKIFQHTFLWTFSSLLNSYVSIIFLNILFDYKDKMWLHVVRIIIIWFGAYTDTFIVPCLGCILVTDKLVQYIKKTRPDLQLDWDLL
jgi:hypothetical protein